MIGKNYYGIATSFYGNKLSVYTGTKQAKQAKLSKLDEHSFIERDETKLQAAIMRLLEIIVRVARMQYREDRQHSSDSFLSLILGWPGIKECPSMTWLGDIDYSNNVDYSDPSFELVHDDRAIRNLRYVIEYNLTDVNQKTGCGNSGLAISAAVFLPPQPMEHDGEYSKDFLSMQAYYERISSGRVDRDALQKLKVYARKYAERSALNGKKLFGTEKIKKVNFAISNDPIYNFFDHPELRDEFVSTYKQVLGIDKNKSFTLKLPKDPSGDEFSDVLNGEMDRLIELYP